MTPKQKKSSLKKQYNKNKMKQNKNNNNKKNQNIVDGFRETTKIDP